LLYYEMQLHSIVKRQNLFEDAISSILTKDKSKIHA
jgi:hypothetical protein